MAAYDLAIVGSGVAGLCTARAFLMAEPEARVVILERGSHVGPEQSTHNSGVLHDGFEYVPGSLKARFATEGTRQATAFCQQHGVAVPNRGLMVVAMQESERAGVETYFERGTANGVACRMIDGAEARKIEPHMAEPVAALHVPGTRSIDSAGYVEALGKEVRELGCEVRLQSPVKTLAEAGGLATLETATGTVQAQRYLNAAGVGVDRLARQVGADDGNRIVPFRGDYYELTPETDHLCRGHIYPAPRLDLPFLGVHFSRTAAGKVIIGPNAALAGGRYKYSPWGLSPRDMAGTLLYPGFRRLMLTKRMLRHAPGEVKKSLVKGSFLKEANRLVPALRKDGMVRSFSGIRAQLVSREGQLVMDLMTTRSERGIHLMSGASPGLTASLPFGQDLAGQLRGI